MAKTIMLVEDDSLLVKMYKTKFESEGYQVLVADDGQKGLEMIQNHKPDFIILDFMMPRLSGMELLAHMQQNPQFKNIPTIMLSNMSNQAQIEKAKKLGAREFLIKANYTPAQIVSKIKQYLK